MEKTEVQIINEILAGDYEQYSFLIDKYKSRVKLVISRYVHQADELDDLAAETFIKAYNSLSSYSPTYAFSTWIMNIARNKAIDYVRGKKSTIPITEVLSDDNEIGIQLSDTEMSVEESIIKNETSKQIEDMIQELKPEYRLLIEMKYLKGMTYEEISQSLNKPINSIKTTLWRAREKLRKSILSNKNIK